MAKKKSREYKQGPVGKYEPWEEKKRAREELLPHEFVGAVSTNQNRVPKPSKLMKKVVNSGIRSSSSGTKYSSRYGTFGGRIEGQSGGPRKRTRKTK